MVLAAILSPVMALADICVAVMAFAAILSEVIALADI